MSLGQHTRTSLFCSLVLSHIDYANAVLTGIAENVLHKLQLVQNWAAKLVLKCKKFSSSSNALFELHWLLIKYRII